MRVQNLPKVIAYKAHQERYFNSIARNMARAEEERLTRIAAEVKKAQDKINHKAEFLKNAHKNKDPNAKIAYLPFYDEVETYTSCCAYSRTYTPKKANKTVTLNTRVKAFVHTAKLITHRVSILKEAGITVGMIETKEYMRFGGSKVAVKRFISPNDYHGPYGYVAYIQGFQRKYANLNGSLGFSARIHMSGQVLLDRQSVTWRK